MTDDVIILGAGFSYDAGIPLLSGFIDQMLDYRLREVANGNRLTEAQMSVFDKALKVRNELDSYHGRVSFDDRNLEDILSILAFNVIGGGRSESQKQTDFTKAITQTIELACNVKHNGVPGPRESFSITYEGDEVYRKFWRALFNRYEKVRTFPTIITLNYDLVLERSLLQTLINKKYRPRFDGIELSYQYKKFQNQCFKVVGQRYNTDHIGQTEEGIRLEPSSDEELKNIVNINLLKLHGSLNFPRKPIDQEPSLVHAVENPYIIPPVSNKNSNTAGAESWRAALIALRQAKNICFVGYSMPKTDIYMQFFLKAALGPNQYLNKVSIFDPVLWRETPEKESMVERFQSCFSQQTRSRLKFKPRFVGMNPDTLLSR